MEGSVAQSKTSRTDDSTSWRHAPRVRDSRDRFPPTTGDIRYTGREPVPQCGERAVCRQATSRELRSLRHSAKGRRNPSPRSRQDKAKTTKAPARRPNRDIQAVDRAPVFGDWRSFYSWRVSNMQVRCQPWHGILIDWNFNDDRKKESGIHRKQAGS